MCPCADAVVRERSYVAKACFHIQYELVFEGKQCCTMCLGLGEGGFSQAAEGLPWTDPGVHSWVPMN